MAVSTGAVKPLLEGGKKMPKVGKKHFPYDKKGKAAAKKEREKQKKTKKSSRYGTEI